MQGKVVGVNGDLCAILVSSGITLLEILGGHVTELGDKISGDLESVGSNMLFNETKKEKLDTFIEDWSCSPEIAKNFLYGLRGKVH